jgi:uncharacterized protein YutE (UPF0331/DUF86 family)
MHLDSSIPALDEVMNQQKENEDREIEIRTFSEDILKHSFTIILFTHAAIESSLNSFIVSSLDRSEVARLDELTTFNRWSELLKLNSNNKGFSDKLQSLIRLRNQVVHQKSTNIDFVGIESIRFINELSNKAYPAIKIVRDVILKIDRDNENEIIKACWLESNTGRIT